MGQANRAPTPHYGRKYDISTHAIERFRERVDEMFTARPNGDLANLLDERICHAESSFDILDHSAGGNPTKATVFRIQSRNGTDSLAVVRDNTCVTVLDEKMLDIKLSTQVWQQVAINTPFRAALAGVKPTRKLQPTKAALAEAVAAGRIPDALAQAVAEVRDCVPPPPEPPKMDEIASAGAAHAHARFAEMAARSRHAAAVDACAAAARAVTEAVKRTTEAARILDDLINNATDKEIS